MKPAFSSPRQALAFALLLAALMAAPALVARTGRLDHRDAYTAVPDNYGPFPFIQKKIFGETGDVDIAFVGSSYLWCAIDTPHVQEKLSEQLGREAEVFTLGWPWSGYDALYFIARDLLDHRHVRMLVIYDEYHGSDAAHFVSTYWFQVGENSEALAGLTWRERASLYGGAVLGMPRHLLSLARPNLLEDPALPREDYWTRRYFAPEMAKRRGALRARLAHNHSANFLPCDARGAARASDVRNYSAETRDSFKFTGPATPQYSLHFARKLAQLCRERGTRLVVLHTPNLPGRGEAVISEREEWPEVLGAPVDIVGIPPEKLFSGIRAEDVPKFFYDDNHLNVNGQDLFTPLITPELLRLYATSTQRP